MNDKLVAVLAATVAVSVALRRVLLAASPALAAFIPHRWGWLPGALALACASIAAGAASAQTWVDYAVLLVTVGAVFAVAAQDGLKSGGES